jgi:hypothetical protein
MPNSSPKKNLTYIDFYLIFFFIITFIFGFRCMNNKSKVSLRALVFRIKREKNIIQIHGYTYPGAFLTW